MKCAMCGVESPTNSSFCPNCGSQLGGNTGTRAAKLSASNASQPNEETLWEGSYSAKALVQWMVGAAILTILGAVAATFAGATGWLVFGIAVVVLWGALGLLAVYQRLAVHYRLTTFRLFHETGLLTRTRDRVELLRIEDVTLTQGPIDRIMNVGTIKVLADDPNLKQIVLGTSVQKDIEKRKNIGELEMKGIDNPRYVADLIDNARRQERMRRAVFMESV